MKYLKAFEEAQIKWRNIGIPADMELEYEEEDDPVEKDLLLAICEWGDYYLIEKDTMNIEENYCFLFNERHYRYLDRFRFNDIPFNENVEIRTNYTFPSSVIVSRYIGDWTAVRYKDMPIEFKERIEIRNK